MTYSYFNRVVSRTRIFFQVCFVPFPLFLCMESTPYYVLSFRIMVFFYLVTTGWMFDLTYVRVPTITHQGYSC